MPAAKRFVPSITPSVIPSTLRKVRLWCEAPVPFIHLILDCDGFPNRMIVCLSHFKLVGNCSGCIQPVIDYIRVCFTFKGSAFYQAVNSQVTLELVVNKPGSSHDQVSRRRVFRPSLSAICLHPKQFARG